jgi:hypothetical protein
MNGFIFRVCAHHGEPVVMNGNGLRSRSGLSIDIPISSERIVNDPNNAVIKDMGNEGRESEYDLGALVSDFEDEYGCKVNYDYDLHDKPYNYDGPQVFEFEVFEPSWPDDDEAKDVIDDLGERLTDWAEGYPTGR